MQNPRLVRLAILCGLVGPVLFGAVIAVLTMLEHDFLLSIGWDPVHLLDWPSGLALGQYGGVMTATFLISGLMMSFFALGLRTQLTSNRLSRIGTTLLVLAGVALAGLVSATDPTIRTTPATWHGILHDTFFAALGLTLLPAMLFLGASFRLDLRWRDLASYTFLTVAVILPAFWLKGGAFYVFLGGMLLWSEVIALRMFRLAWHPVLRE